MTVVIPLVYHDALSASSAHIKHKCFQLLFTSVYFYYAGVKTGTVKYCFAYFAYFCE